MSALAVFGGFLLARFDAPAWRDFAARFGGALLGRLDDRFVVVFLAARALVVVRFVVMTPPERSTLSETKGRASTPGSVIDDVHELEALGLRWRLGCPGNHPDFLIAHRLENAHHERVSHGNLGEKILKGCTHGMPNRVRR